MKIDFNKKYFLTVDLSAFKERIDEFKASDEDSKRECINDIFALLDLFGIRLTMITASENETGMLLFTKWQKQ